MQETVLKRLSQRFRNMRRYSELSGTITVKASLSNPQTETINSKATDKEDLIAYKRNMESLLQELKKPHPQSDLVKKLMKLTFDKRRKVIDDSLLHTTKLLERNFHSLKPRHG